MISKSGGQNIRAGRTCLLLLALLTGLCALVSAQAKPPEDEATANLRRQALELYRQGKFVDAMPLLEKLSATNSQDFVVKEHWAYCILEYSKTLTDPAQRKAARLQARQLGVEAKKLGDEGELLEVLLSIPEDGSDLKFSERPDVDDAMKAAESSRAKGDMEQARKGYLHVLELDPKNYDATVYVGDVYFSRKPTTVPANGLPKRSNSIPTRKPLIATGETPSQLRVKMMRLATSTSTPWSPSPTSAHLGPPCDSGRTA